VNLVFVLTGTWAVVMNAAAWLPPLDWQSGVPEFGWLVASGSFITAVGMPLAWALA